MPIYEYRCGECQHELEALQSLSDPRLTDCPECGAPALKRLMSAVGFRLKGGGWYETDFKSRNQRNVAGEGGDAKSSGGKTESAGTSSGGSGSGGSGDSAGSSSTAATSGAASGASSGKTASGGGSVQSSGARSSSTG